MKRVWSVKLRNTQTPGAFAWAGEVVATTAEEAIGKAKARAKRELNQKHDLVLKLKYRGEAMA